MFRKKDFPACDEDLPPPDWWHDLSLRLTEAVYVLTPEDDDEVPTVDARRAINLFIASAKDAVDISIALFEVERPVEAAGIIDTEPDPEFIKQMYADADADPDYVRPDLETALRQTCDHKFVPWPVNENPPSQNGVWTICGLCRAPKLTPSTIKVPLH